MYVRTGGWTDHLYLTPPPPPPPLVFLVPPLRRGTGRLHLTLEIFYSFFSFSVSYVGGHLTHTRCGMSVDGTVEGWMVKGKKYWIRMLSGLGEVMWGPHPTTTTTVGSAAAQ